MTVVSRARRRALTIASAACAATWLACGATPAPTVATPAPATSTSGAALAEANAWADAEAADRALEVAAGDCANACTALSTLTRARQLLCEAKSARCRDASALIDRDTARVDATCGSCTSER